MYRTLPARKKIDILNMGPLWPPMVLRALGIDFQKGGSGPENLQGSRADG